MFAKQRKLSSFLWVHRVHWNDNQSRTLEYCWFTIRCLIYTVCHAHNEWRKVRTKHWLGFNATMAGWNPELRARRQVHVALLRCRFYRSNAKLEGNCKYWWMAAKRIRPNLNLCIRAKLVHVGFLRGWNTRSKAVRETKTVCSCDVGLHCLRIQ